VNSPAHRRVRAGSAVAVALLALVLGCSSKPPRGQVSGTVTLDGQPLENGTIQFYPAKGVVGQTAGGGIENGKYSVETSVGEMTVTINGTKVVGKQKMYDTPDSPVVDKVIELIPQKYNALSELKVTVAQGPNENVNFDLKSK
jgi:hypothetical protein